MVEPAGKSAIDDTIADLLNRAEAEDIYYTEEMCKRVCDDLGIPFASLQVLFKYDPSPHSCEVLNAIELEQRTLFLQKYLEDFQRMLPV